MFLDDSEKSRLQVKKTAKSEIKIKLLGQITPKFSRMQNTSKVFGAAYWSSRCMIEGGGLCSKCNTLPTGLIPKLIVKFSVL